MARTVLIVDDSRVVRKAPCQLFTDEDSVVINNQDSIVESAHWDQLACQKRCRIEHYFCRKETIGLLYRRHVHIGAIIPIGKESNSLEEVDAGLIHSVENVYTVYPRP